MERKKIIVIVVVIAVVLLGIGFWFWSTKTSDNKKSGDCGNQKPTSSATLFFSTSCPHCIKVEAYIDENKVECRINLEMLEVSGSQSNAQKFFEIANGCGVNQENAGVPLLYAENKCFQGDSEIIDFFNKKK